ncbi:hypothetical protein [Micromonospora sp. NBC_01638]|uniref:hypothetical protein n=1 Tax=Micromonospora sp. NBC_01638 TaxID=2975982 RepID=UPI00386610A3|nr:hypothetical protein OG811_19910 [Micromonospora sp. NBC_01638]
MPSIDDDALLGIRQSSTYRAAIWFARVANLVILPVVAWGAASAVPSVPTLPDSVFLAAWAVGCSTLLPAVVLFYRSGVPFERRVGAWVTDRRTNNTVLRDIFWLRH